MEMPSSARQNILLSLVVPNQQTPFPSRSSDLFPIFNSRVVVYLCFFLSLPLVLSRKCAKLQNP